MGSGRREMRLGAVVSDGGNGRDLGEIEEWGVGMIMMEQGLFIGCN